MISVIIPALNEEQNLLATILNIVKAAEHCKVFPYEIIVVNDGSTDGTAQVISEIEKRYPFVKSIHNEKNIGIGLSFLKALKDVKYEKVTIFPGDNYSTLYLIENLFKHVNSADLIISYTINTECRKKIRNVLSTVFCTIYMVAFDIHVKYVNGSPIYPTKVLKSLNLFSTRYSIFAEITIKLLRSGVKYMEVEGYMNPEAKKSSALKIRNLVEVIFSFCYLLYDIHFKNRKVYQQKSERVIPKSILTAG